jgi:hypothetical protein
MGKKKNSTDSVYFPFEKKSHPFAIKTKNIPRVVVSHLWAGKKKTLNAFAINQ